MWRVPVGTQIPVEVIETKPDKHVSVRHMRYSSATGLFTFPGVFGKQDVRYKIVSVYAILTDGAAVTVTLTLARNGTDVWWQSQWLLQAKAGGSTLSYDELGTNSVTSNTANTEAVSVKTPPFWFDDSFNVEFDGRGTTELAITWWEEKDV